MGKAPRSDRDIISRQVRALLDREAQIKTVATVLDSHREEVREPDFGDFVRSAVTAVGQDGANILVVPGEILVHDEHADDAQAMLGADFRREPIGCPELPVARFRSEVADLAAATDALHDAGIPANFSHITPSGPYIKGAGGAEMPNGMPVEPESKVGEGRIRVAIIDTGINMDDTDWPSSWLAGITQDRANMDPLTAVSNGPLDHGGGHGTFVVGVVRQVTPNAQIRVYRALDSDGIGSEVAVACAILRAVADGVDIINLSLGTDTYKDRPPVALTAALELVPDEVVVVAAAGNDGSSRPNWPGAVKRVVAVGALDQDMKPAKWSNRGPWVDLSTVGEGVVSTFVSGYETAVQDPEPEDWRSDKTPWAMWTGTSFAAPQIAGLIARDAEGSDARTALANLRATGVHVADWGIAIASPLKYSLV